MASGDRWAQMDLVRPHVDSFDYVVEGGGGFDTMVEYLEPVRVFGRELQVGGHDTAPDLRIEIEKLELHRAKSLDDRIDTRVLPSECRQRHTTYSGTLSARVCCYVDEKPIRFDTVLGDIPIMVRSKACHLSGMTAKELEEHHEESNELGGYFIINGIERLLRLLINKRRNLVVCQDKAFYSKKNPDFTSYAVTIRSVRPDNSGKNVTLHYMKNGSVCAGLYIRRIEYFVPALTLLRACIESTDRELFEKLTQCDSSNSFVMNRVEVLLREGTDLQLRSQYENLAYLGKTFRVVLRLPEELTDEQVGLHFLSTYLFPHCSTLQHKFDLMVHMMRKLYALANEEIQADNVDALTFHEALLPGHLYMLVVKGNCETQLAALRRYIIHECKSNPATIHKMDAAFFSKAFERSGRMTSKMNNFLATGNVTQGIDVELPQYSGLAITAERLNHLRYLAHFRSIHRGQFFTTMRTTAIRKLLPESWGFMCPVHTPDGTPCGLLNHLAAHCDILTRPTVSDRTSLVATLASLGVVLNCQGEGSFEDLPVLVDGIVVGSLPLNKASSFEVQLRGLKCKAHRVVPSTLTVHVVTNKKDGMYPCVVLSTHSSRFIRPVRNLLESAVEMICPLDQLMMSIACTEKDIRKQDTTHQEVSPTHMLSMLASCTPFSDFNQSPRNMYQCQMAKQTMGTPYFANSRRVDNKIYMIQNPQKPIVRNKNQDVYDLDGNPVGVCAVVAVVSYTGYDMEDAMIINKSAYERGFGHGSVFTTVIEDLSPEAAKRFSKNASKKRFGNKHVGESRVVSETLGVDGIAPIGTFLEKGDPMYCVIDETTGDVMIKRHKKDEPAYVESAVITMDPTGKYQKLSLKLRFNRNPVIGDKFSSRHGQKGVLSQLWPQIDMPFTEGGMTPDIIINPHAFPSRMTIGMLIESMAGKVACLEGAEQDATPFHFNEKNTAVNHFGSKLKDAGYNFLGNETMYSGVSGERLEADVFFGVVYYQRLRHMVSDKAQVRSMGPVNALTKQPVQGRKRGGGVRFGEMERDSLLGHGASFLLNDRLMNCSDKHTAFVCLDCGDLLASSAIQSKNRFSTRGTALMASGAVAMRPMTCANCGSKQRSKPIHIPYVLTYLASELSSLNVQVKLGIKP